jgi:hypothetical protein
MADNNDHNDNPSYSPSILQWVLRAFSPSGKSRRQGNVTTITTTTTTTITTTTGTTSASFLNESTLPSDLLFHTLSYLDLPSLLRSFASASASFHSLLSSSRRDTQSLFRCLLLKEVGGDLGCLETYGIDDLNWREALGTWWRGELTWEEVKEEGRGRERRQEGLEGGRGRGSMPPSRYLHRIASSSTNR